MCQPMGLPHAHWLLRLRHASYLNPECILKLQPAGGIGRRRAEAQASSSFVPRALNMRTLCGGEVQGCEDHKLFGLCSGINFHVNDVWLKMCHSSIAWETTNFEECLAKDTV